MPCFSRKHHAFTLVELSVVLVIIGLLVAGVLAAQDMIRASERRAMIRQISEYETILSLFRDKYDAIPGDMPNAEDFWGTDSSGCPTGGGATGTCNGDGNGIFYWNGSEGFRAWQQLSYAGLLKETYTGVSSGATQRTIPGTNIPAIPLHGEQAAGGVSFGPVQGSTEYRAALVPARNMLRIGSANPSSNDLWGRLISGSELWGIDKKIDDGMASSGKLIARTAQGGTNCLSGETATAGTYILSSSDKGCSFYISINGLP